MIDYALRGLGLGRWLVEESIRYCKREGFSIVYLWTVKGLDRAIWLYESVGFTRSQRRVSRSGGNAV
jgi:GNAT superfamily N-acetyltransferase